MLRELFDTIIERALTRVFGHYAHPYVLTFAVPISTLASGYRTHKQIKFIGTHNGAVKLAKEHLKAGRAVHCVIHTRGGVLVWEGTSG